ncbi:MAG: flagellar motor switch protein FliG [Candidatus Solibacter sp.]
MIANTQSAAIARSGIEKAAILLVVLGDQASANIVKQLSEDAVELVSREVARLKRVSPEDAEAVVEEFYQLTSAQEYIATGGVEYAKGMLLKAFGPEVSKRMMDRLLSALENDMTTFDALQKADPQQLAKFLHSEHPQTIALVLAHLNPSQAAALLSSLPPEMRGDVALRVASLDQISPEVIGKIASVIGQKLNALGQFSRESYGGVRTVAEMFNRLDSAISKDILQFMGDQDAALVEAVQHLMFVFDDLLLLDEASLKEVLGKVDRKVLTLALKGTGEGLKNHFLKGMSSRGAEMLREDMEGLGAVKIKDVEAAQQQMIAVVRQLENEGVLSVRGTVGEQYVV